MYAEILDKAVNQFMAMIEEGKIYDIRKFFVFPKKYVFRPVDGKSMIKFTRYTSVVERMGLESLFPFCTYKLTPFAQLPRPSDMPERFIGFSSFQFSYRLPTVYVSLTPTNLFSLTFNRCAWGCYRCF
jgi:hypothetical protein